MCVNLSKCHAYSIAGAIVFDLLVVSVCGMGGWLVCLAVGVYCEYVRQMAHPLHLHVPPYTLPRILCLGQQPVTFQHVNRRGEGDIIVLQKSDGILTIGISALKKALM